MTVKERLEEIKGKFMQHEYDSNLTLNDINWLIQQAERVKELEYASKYNGELNEFLQKRKLPPDTLGRHVVDVVMEYVEELENLRRGDLAKLGELADVINELQDENDRYKQALEFYAVSGQGIGETKHGEVARQALNQSK